MSGGSQQKRIIKRAVEAALAKIGVSAQKPSAQQGGENKEQPKMGILSRSTIEAYVLFMASGFYVVMSAFGITVNFVAGALVLVIMAYCAIDLVWHVSFTVRKPRMAKALGTVILVVGTLDMMRAGWIRTHRESSDEALADLIVGKIGSALKQQSVVDTKPDFEIKVGEELITIHGSKETTGTDLFLLIGLINHGSPGSLGGWSLHYHSATLDTTVPYQKLVTVPIKNERTGKVWRFFDEDNIYEKTMNPVPRNAIIRGWSRFSIPGDRSSDFPRDHAGPIETTLWAWDNAGRKYEVPFKSEQSADLPGYWPGTKGPAVK